MAKETTIGKNTGEDEVRHHTQDSTMDARASFDSRASGGINQRIRGQDGKAQIRKKIESEYKVTDPEAEYAMQ